jgi:precorrin-4/cobalt-precorrin-4 C11-methyltransferase
MKTLFHPFFSMPLLLFGLALAGSNPHSTCCAAEHESTQFYLVGLGPGDPDLMTLRAVSTIQQADVIFCSKGWSNKLGQLLEGKEVYHDYWRLFPFYGQDPSKLHGDERRQCEEYNRKRDEFTKLVRQAVAAGKTVAMLDGGDPLVYGPCAWALEELEDLDPVVVPGVSCFNAANAALKRGVTTSDRTKSVILTAADWLGKEDTIEKMSVHQTSMVLFTMKTEFKEFIDKLSINYPPETPIAIVKHAGYADKEEVIESTLGKVLDDIDSDTLPFEYLIYVGDFLTHRYKQSTTAQATGTE